MSKTVICRDVFGNEYERNVEDLVQTIRVYAFVVVDEKLLVTKQWDGYSLPGGGVEKGEDLEEALVREVKEETGLDIVPGKPFYNTSRLFQRDKDSEAKQAFMFYFDAASITGEITNDAITESEQKYTQGIAEWIPLADIDESQFRHSVTFREILQQYFETV